MSIRLEGEDFSCWPQAAVRASKRSRGVFFIPPFYEKQHLGRIQRESLDNYYSLSKTLAVESGGILQ